MNRIVLMGFPGSGKTSIARQLANKLNFNWIDLDEVIEKQYHLTIFDIISKYGEEVFRKCEYEQLKQALKLDCYVIALGGGTPCFFDAIEQIKTHSLSVYLFMTEAALFQRLSHAKKKRPLLVEQDLQEYIHKTMKVRQAFYSQADICFPALSAEVEKLAEEIKKHIVNKT